VSEPGATIGQEGNPECEEAEHVRTGPEGYSTVQPWLVNDAVLLAFDARPDWPDTPSMLRIFADDAAATFDRGVAAGARVVTRWTTPPGVTPADGSAIRSATSGGWPSTSRTFRQR